MCSLMFLVLVALSWVTAPCAAEILSNRTDILTLARIVTSFSRDLYGQLARKDVNLLYSPLSVHANLAMTYAGAGNETAQAIATTLRLIPELPYPHNAYNDLIDSFNINSNVRLVNGIWSSVPIDPAYSTFAELLYKSPAQPIDFAIEAPLETTINRWVSEKSNNRILEILANGDITNATSLLLVNTFFIAGSWTPRFDLALTVTAQFHLSDGSFVYADFITQSQTYQLKLSAFSKVDIVRMPFTNTRFALYVILPISGVGLDELETDILSGNIDIAELFTGLQATRVTVTLPKFTIKTKINLNRTLGALGMPVAFLGNADFTRISENRSQISDVFQTATIELTERGIYLMSNPHRAPGVPGVLTDPAFKADHPFMFFVRDDLYEMILLQGKLSNPAISETNAD